MSLLPKKGRGERGEGEHGLMSLRDDVNRLFDSFWRGDWRLEPFREWGRFSLDLDVSEDDNAVTIKADVPGMQSKDIELSVSNNMLTIKGEKSEEKEDKEKDFYRSERRYGAFSRMIPLPASVDANKVTAECKKGVLKITLPKLESEKPKRITVKGESESKK